MISARGANFTIGALIKSLLFGDVGFGDAFMKGHITVDGNLAQWLERNSGTRKWPYMPTTTRNVGAHYNISSAFYEILLGNSMSYTCANWMTPEGVHLEGLHRAQVEKCVRHVKWLDLSANGGRGLKHLDCGSGWGSFMEMVQAIAVDLEVNCMVDGLTLSHEQVVCVNNTHPELNSVHVGDWGDFYCEGHYDRFSAIGMLEHVGKHKIPDFFKWVNTILSPGGVGVLQFCSRDTPISRWTDKHIFPGAQPPNLNEVCRHMRQNDLGVTDIVECGNDYVKTLECWLDNLESNIGKIKVLGYNDKFIRMFRLYLNGGICSFRMGNTQLIQLRFEKAL
jgi:cyclopropane-fatty-acyl-phospholipid synthase